jgi:sulfite exporter TauE/SafE
LGDRGQSLATRLLGPKETWLLGRATTGAGTSVAANLALRLFQVHFAIAMVASGLNKLQAKEWWSGLAAWFYLHPPFHTTLEEVRSFAPNAETMLTFLTLASYLALAWQLAFPAFAWRRSLRPVLLGGAALAWVACACLVPLPLFGPLMMVACLGYLSPAEWRRLQALAARLPGVGALVGRLSPAPWGAVLPGPKGGAVAKAASVTGGTRG